MSACSGSQNIRLMLYTICGRGLVMGARAAAPAGPLAAVLVALWQHLFYLVFHIWAAIVHTIQAEISLRRSRSGCRVCSSCMWWPPCQPLIALCERTHAAIYIMYAFHVYFSCIMSTFQKKRAGCHTLPRSWNRSRPVSIRWDVGAMFTVIIYYCDRWYTASALACL
jgi:hypothetical protein